MSISSVQNLSPGIGNVPTPLPYFSQTEQPLKKRVHDYAKYFVQNMRLLTAHRDPIWDITVLPNNQIASASFDKTAHILSQNSQLEWNTTSILKGHKEDVLRIEYYDANKLVTASSDGQLKFWNVNTGKLFRSFGEQKEALWGFASLAIIDVNTIATGALHRPRSEQTCDLPIDDHTIKLWDIQTGRQTATFPAHSKGISDLLYWDEKQLMISTSGDATVKIWDLKKPTAPLASTLVGHEKYIYCSALIKEQEIIATAGGDGSIKLWNPEAEQSDSLKQNLERAHEDSIYDLGLLRHNLLMSASKDCQLRIWDLRNFELARIIPTSFMPYAIDVLDNGDIVAAGANNNDAELTIFNFL